jgi:hypothetical protein
MTTNKFVETLNYLEKHLKFQKIRLDVISFENVNLDTYWINIDISSEKSYSMQRVFLDEKWIYCIYDIENSRFEFNDTRYIQSSNLEIPEFYDDESNCIICLEGIIDQECIYFCEYCGLIVHYDCWKKIKTFLLDGKILRACSVCRELQVANY